MRLANIGVLLFSLWTRIKSCADEKCKACGYNYKLYPVSNVNLKSFLGYSERPWKNSTAVGREEALCKGYLPNE